MKINVLYSEEEIQAKIKELAEEMNKFYNGEEVYVICALKGAVMFAVDLVKHLNMPLKMEFIRYNNNPKNKKTGDCVVRAIAFVTNRSWEFVYMALAQLGVDSGLMMNNNKNWQKYLEILGYSSHVFYRHDLLASFCCLKGFYSTLYFLFKKYNILWNWTAILVCGSF